MKKDHEKKNVFCININSACREIFLVFLSSDFFPKSFFSKNSFRNTIRVTVSNSLNPEHASHFHFIGLGPSCLQSLSADDTNKQR